MTKHANQPNPQVEQPRNAPAPGETQQPLPGAGNPQGEEPVTAPQHGADGVQQGR